MGRWFIEQRPRWIARKRAILSDCDDTYGRAVDLCVGCGHACLQFITKCCRCVSEPDARSACAICRARQ